MQYSQLMLLLLAGACMLSVYGSGLTLSVEGQAKEQALEGSWSATLESTGKESPIKRVENLLLKMKAELEAEAANESKMYDQMVCWCETNEKEKTKAIADGDAKDKLLVAEISSRSARFGVLATEIAKLKEQIAEDSKALSEATALREKEAAEFMDEEKSLVQALTNLKNAVSVLSKHNSASFLQTDGSLMSSLRAVLRDTALKYEYMLAGEKTQSEKHVAFLSVATSAGVGVDHDLLSALNTQDEVGDFDSLPLKYANKVITDHIANAPKSTFLQQPATAKEGSYQSQSGAIFGILNQMKEEFETNLATAQKEEAKASSDYEAMSGAKKAQIESGKTKLDEMESEHASNQKALSDAKEDLDLTRSQRTVDVEFMRNLRLQCQDLDRQFVERSKTRAAETEAVSKAIAVITEDDAQEVMNRSVSLLQVNTVEGAEMLARRNRAVSSLMKAVQAPVFAADDLLAAWHDRQSGPSGAWGANSPRTRLSTLAVSVKMDSFAEVMKAMDEMVATLKEEQKTEVAFKANCEKNFDENEKTTLEKTDVKEDLEGKMDALKNDIKSLEEEIDEATKQISETQISIKKASETRESENAEFQTTVADARATQAILAKALKSLESFYKKAAAAMVQQQADQAPPVQFNSYKKNAGSGPVMGLIEQIVEDSKALETESVTAEKSAQAEYETFVKNSNAVVDDLTNSVNEKTKAVSDKKLELQTAESDHESTVGELNTLASVKADLHSECDFVLGNFEIRQKARLEEMEAIESAKLLISGHSEEATPAPVEAAPVDSGAIDLAGQ
eukprot:gnl/TRDRNA2_/TRDRNA2_175597_c6_seq4.p1 gnl/TRDRNA2_/TRDRNA2_175597_c6~~gnl/TRDRNA2_/TRDRNA2_175597_c6_seq4.p1  ORF type:complete len:793 (+),score=260.23 gnl/TRDRNA2_/TRDRNA2_175597_c6_seq4:82-2460(+)